MRETVNLNDIYPLIREVIDKGGVFHLYPRGTSMLPMIREGIDSIELGAVDTSDLKIGDVLFYRRENGQFVLHRLIGFHKDTLLMCGDNQTWVEYGIRREQVLAKLVGYYVGEEHRSLDSKAYIAYARERVHRIPIYLRNQTLYEFARAVKHCFFRPKKQD